jgi:hypothetical protein
VGKSRACKRLLNRGVSKIGSDSKTGAENLAPLKPPQGLPALSASKAGGPLADSNPSFYPLRVPPNIFKCLPVFRPPKKHQTKTCRF